MCYLQSHEKILLLFLTFPILCLSAQQKQPYKIIAYYTGNGEAIKQWPVDKLTHIIFSFLKIQNDTLTFHNQNQEKSLQQLVALKKEYPQLKIMVSIGGWGGCSFCSSLFAGDEHRRHFAKTTVALFKQYGIDGIDLDWEYPAIEGYPGHAYAAADKNNFTELVKALRQEMGNNYLLTFAAGGFVKYLEQSIDWDAVMPLVDFVNLMTYDLVGGYATVTGHHTPLYDYRPGQESTAKCVNWLLDKKVAANKLIIGAAMYARVWEQVPANGNGLYQAGIFKRGVAYADFSNYFSDTSGFTYYWDKKAMAPYRYNASQQLFATFDDKRSIRAKTKFIRRKKLGGIMFWELGQDLKEGGLLKEMERSLGK
ncbi:MAG: glycoside hydrolase family 18 protein [Chitinophagaceae bacterium]|nr:glycoside hydrolase family 18 protein [Chitinophagaceae bacterium]